MLFRGLGYVGLREGRRDFQPREASSDQGKPKGFRHPRRIRLETSQSPWESHFPGRSQDPRERRDVRHLPPRPGGRRLPDPRGGGRGLRRHGGTRRQLRAHIHGAAGLAAGSRPSERPLGDGRGSLGGAHHLPRRSWPAAPRSSAGCARRSGRPRGHPAILCYAIGNEIPASIVRWYGPRRIERFLKRLYRAAKQEDPECPRHLRELPEHRVPATALHRPRLLQRLPRVGPAVRVIPRAPSEHRRRPPAAGHRGRPRLAAQLRGGPGARDRLAGADGVREVAARACSCSPGPTSGTAAASTSTTGPSGWSTATVSPSRRWPRSARRSPRRRSGSIRTGRASRWWCAPTTPSAPSPTASTDCARSSTRTSR